MRWGFRCVAQVLRRADVPWMRRLLMTFGHFPDEAFLASQASTITLTAGLEAWRGGETGVLNEGRLYLHAWGFRPEDIALAAEGGEDTHLDGFVAALGKLPLEFSPGEAWNYSVSTDVLGIAVERLSGLRLGDYFERHIFAPLGMTGSNPTDRDMERHPAGATPHAGHHRRRGELGQAGRALHPQSGVPRGPFPVDGSEIARRPSDAPGPVH